MFKYIAHFMYSLQTTQICLLALIRGEIDKLVNYGSYCNISEFFFLTFVNYRFPYLDCHKYVCALPQLPVKLEGFDEVFI